MANFVSIVKEGSIIIMQTSEREKPFLFNCAERTLHSFTGRKVTTVNPLLRQCGENGNRGQCFLVEAITKYLYNGDYRYMARIENYITCLDLLEGYDCSDIPDKCPKGYIKWVRENGLTISHRTITQFTQEQAVKQMTKNVKEVYNIIKQNYGHSTHSYMIYFFELSSEQREIFCKIFKTSMKSFMWNFGANMEHFLYNIRANCINSDFPPDWHKHVDTNRDFIHNTEMLKELKYKARNDKILEWENHFTAIEDLSNDNFVVIVPKAMKDFTDEGKQQNNCVGYFYHESMADHRQIIYFIRKKSTPTKSYITNRYQVTWKQTVETRIVNNGNNNDKLALELIAEIDKKITEILETL